MLKVRGIFGNEFARNFVIFGVDNNILITVLVQEKKVLVLISVKQRQNFA